jgi:hypothetical protein
MISNANIKTYEQIEAEILETGAADKIVSCPHMSTDYCFFWGLHVESRTRILLRACPDCIERLKLLEAIEGIREA